MARNRLNEHPLVIYLNAKELEKDNNHYWFVAETCVCTVSRSDSVTRS